MKKYATLLMMTSVLLSGCASHPENPLLAEWKTPHGVPPFDQIKLEHYRPAVDSLISLGRDAIRQIAENPEAPTFENTVVALETAQQPLERVLTLFFNLNSAETSDSMQALAMELSPVLTEFSNDIMLNEPLFARVRSLYEQRAGLGLTQEGSMLLENSYKQFVRSGANLTPEQKERYRTLTTELSQRSLQFEQNLLGATNAFQLEITDSTELAGLPASIRDAAAHEAKEAGKSGWLFTLQAPSYVPFVTYAERRDLREKLYRAFSSRAFNDAFDNQQNILQIANLRLELANLLGYPTYADYVLEERMAKDIAHVDTMLNQLLGASKGFAQNEVATIAAYAKTEGFAETLMPWDWSFWSERYKESHYNLTDEMTRPYFRLESVQDALFLMAGKLYGLEFRENAKLPVYHPDVHAFEVYDKDGELLSVLYIDYFPRAGKRGGAWMTSYRQACVENGKPVIPIVSLVCNFTKPTETTPSLLTLDEVVTVFHEFGHGLHGMIGKGTYASLTGTNVYRDFVELPSQLMENWVDRKEFLDLWATHYQTGEKMPAELIAKIEASKRYLAAYLNVRQLQFGITDMAWHTVTAPVTTSVPAFERAATQRTSVLPVVDGTCFSTNFAHVFSGGYAAGYYSYKWAEVLEADAFEHFTRAPGGIFDPEVAASFRKHILEPGGSRPAMELYVEFAGAEPTVAPLLRKMGLDTPAN